MSSVSLGASRVGRVMTLLANHGYRCGRISASGQRKGARREENCIPADIIAIAMVPGMPHLIVEVGGAGKRLGVAFGEMREFPLPGFCPLVVRYVERKSWFYVDEDTRVPTATEALDALKSLARS